MLAKFLTVLGALSGRSVIVNDAPLASWTTALVAGSENGLTAHPVAVGAGVALAATVGVAVSGGKLTRGALVATGRPPAPPPHAASTTVSARPSAFKRS